MKDNKTPLFSNLILLLIALGTSIVVLFAIRWMRGSWSPTLALPAVLLTLAVVIPFSDFIRHRFRLSFRSLLVMITATAILLSLCGSQLSRIRRQRVAVRSVIAAGGEVYYQNHRELGADLIKSRNGWILPSWIAEVLGQDAVFNVAWVSFADVDLSGDDALANVQLDQFTDLNFNGSKIGDRALERIAANPNLRELDLSCTGMSDAKLAAISNMVGLETLYLNNHLTESTKLTNSITDAGLTHLRQLSNLRSLILAATGITGNGLVHLQSLSKLNLLDINDTGISNEDVRHLQKLTQLKGLGLRNTLVDEGCLSSLESMPNLEWVSFSASSPEVKAAIEKEQEEMTSRRKPMLYVD